MLETILNTTRILKFDGEVFKAKAVDETTADGVYEVIDGQMNLTFFSIRNGVRRDLTEKQAIRRALDVAGLEPETGKKRDSSRFAKRRQMILRALLHRAMSEALSKSTNGTTLTTSLKLPAGSTPTAESDRVVVGKYRGSFKGRPIFGTTHSIAGSEIDFLNALLTHGTAVLSGEFIVMRSEPVTTIAGESAEDPRRVHCIVAVRQARAGAEVVERFYVEDEKRWLIAKSLPGAKTMLKNLIAEREAAKIEREQAAERQRAYREERQRIREAEERARIPFDDLDALASY